MQPPRRFDLNAEIVGYVPALLDPKHGFWVQDRFGGMGGSVKIKGPSGQQGRGSQARHKDHMQELALRKSSLLIHVLLMGTGHEKYSFKYIV